MIRQLHHKLVSQGPALLRIPAQITPFSVKRHVLLQTLQRVFDESLQDGDFEFLTDRWLQIEVIDLGLTAYISYRDDQLIVEESLIVKGETREVDVAFRGNANDLVLIAARREDPDTLFFQRRLNIEGDTELGLEVKNLIDSVDWDALPTPLVVALGKLADFIEVGLSQPTEETVHANSH